MAKQLRGAITTSDGNLRAWTGVPVGVATPIIVWRVLENLLLSKVASSIETAAIQEADISVGAISSKSSLYSTIAYASPFVLALPFLLSKKTRGAALGIIGGGLVGDVISILWIKPRLKSTSSASASDSSGGQSVQTEGGIIARPVGR